MLDRLKHVIPASARKVLRQSLLGARAHARISYSQEGEDLLLLRLLAGKSPGMFVDVGAHHPYRFSNTYLLYLLGWRGINIDPRQGMSAEFRRARPQDINLELGVSLTAGHREFHVFEEPALNTFDGNLAAQRIAEGWTRLATRAVDCQPLGAILAKHVPQLGSRSADLLTVDAEGSDLEVLRSNDWGLFRPRWVLVEILDTSLVDAAGSETARYLSTQGYELHAKWANSVLFAGSKTPLAEAT